jgi:hypothetical protein
MNLVASARAKDNRIVAVKPNTAFPNHFTVASEMWYRHPKSRRGR